MSIIYFPSAIEIATYAPAYLAPAVLALRIPVGVACAVAEYRIALREFGTRHLTLAERIHVRKHHPFLRVASNAKTALTALFAGLLISTGLAISVGGTW